MHKHGRLTHPIAVELYTGRRKDAILSLRWHQVHLETGTIDFEQGQAH
jgi:hypothetical protein